MALLTVVFVLGTVVRVALLFLRPSAEERFHTTRRRLLATRAEQGGDVLCLFTIVCMFLFGYRHHPGGLLVFFWLVCLLGGFGLSTFAHDLARRHRPHGVGGLHEPATARPAPPTERERPAARAADRPRASGRSAGPRPPRPAGTLRPVEPRRRPGPTRPGRPTGARPAGPPRSARPAAGGRPAGGPRPTGPRRPPGAADRPGSPRSGGAPIRPRPAPIDEVDEA